MSAERTFRVAVVGATGLVGGEIVSLLAERGFPVSELALYASDRSRGESLEWEGESVEVKPIERPLPECDVAFLCASPEVSAELRDELAGTGAVVVDLVPPGPGARGSAPSLTAAEARASLQSAGTVVRVPDPLTRLIAVPVLALRELAVPRRVVVTLVASASRFGKASVERLSRETIGLLNLREQDEEEEPTVAFRCIPLERGAAADRVEAELRELLGEEIAISTAVVRAPMFHGNAASIAVELDAPVDAAAVRETLRQAPSLLVADEGETPASTFDALASDAMQVVQIDCATDDPTWVRFWVLGDNVRQGAALAAVAMVEGLLLRH